MISPGNIGKAIQNVKLRVDEVEGSGGIRFVSARAGRKLTITKCNLWESSGLGAVQKQFGVV
jgi:hypothetical protein